MNIAIAAYNRSKSLERLINSLEQCENLKAHKLYIFLDYDDQLPSQKEIIEVLKKYDYIEVLKSDKRLGLKENIYRIFHWAAGQDQPTIVLEDDLYVSKDLLNYAQQAIDQYNLDSSIGMISLYHQHYMVTNEFPFFPIDDDSDVYFMQFASSSGFVITAEMAANFMNYTSMNAAYDFSLLPQKLQHWPETSWKKIFNLYLLEKNIFTVFPRVSITTNFGDQGQNHLSQSHHFQSILRIHQKPQYKFVKLDQSPAVYDIYMELIANKNIYPELGDISFDLNGFKRSEHIHTALVVTSKITSKAIKTFGRNLKPQEANIIKDIEGHDFYLLKKEDYEDAKLPSKHESKLLDYFYIFSSKSVLAKYLKDTFF